jgi:putative transcriptional regulator
MPTSLTGKLLIAGATLTEPVFKRSVLLVCEHTEDGAFGLVLNRPIDLTLGEALPEFLEAGDLPLFVGGPVSDHSLHVLHSLGNEIDGSIPVADGVFWGGNFETMKMLIQTQAVPLTQFRFYLGYAGWGAGQLENELSESAWYVSSASQNVVFADDTNKLWRTVLRGMGGDFAILANFPDDPQLN